MVERIQCTESEKEVFDLIRKHSKEFEDVVPRVAGGWVRDKIMGNPSFDMDIALENISGYEFAIGLERCATNQRLTDVHLIKNNPEKSKHLETAVIRINGLCVDFVNLRSEKYSETRIPEIVPGTPQEDALRRDLTINSLFYNLFTDEVEDYTGRGIDDIRNGVLVTPLDARITLFDDPLRIVRIFRFHSKLGFSIDEKIYDALSDERIKDALMKKVSNERVCIEIFKIIHYPRGQYGLLEIIKRNYVNPIFKPPVDVLISHSDGLLFCETIEKITNMWGRGYRREILNLYTILCAFTRSTTIIGGKEISSSVHIMKNSLPSPKSFVKVIEKIEGDLIFIDGHDLKNLSHEDLIRMVRRMEEIWYESLIIYSAIEFVRGRHEAYKDGLRTIYQIIQNGVEECYLRRSIVDARQIQQDLGISPSDLRFYIEEGIVYQIISNTNDPGKVMDYLRGIMEKDDCNQ